MKFYTRLLLSLMTLGAGSMNAVSRPREIELSNKTSGNKATSVDVTIITDTKAHGTATVGPDSQATLKIYDQGDGIGQIQYLSTGRLKEGKPKVNTFYAIGVRKTDFPVKDKKIKEIAKTTDKLRGLESLTFSYVGNNFTIEGVNNNDDAVKLLP